jgi:hypothetical protein
MFFSLAVGPTGNNGAPGFQGVAGMKGTKGDRGEFYFQTKKFLNNNKYFR